ncbi:MAG: ribbon-helix-helix protein, CopG family [Bryobacteraceae bacterium]
MASTNIRSTYALDEDTVQRLGNLAKQWNVSKSEALRRAIRMADAQLPADDRLAALRALQASMRLSGKAAEEWVRRVRRERRASSRPAAGQP